MCKDIVADLKIALWLTSRRAEVVGFLGFPPQSPYKTQKAKVRATD